MRRGTSPRRGPVSSTRRRRPPRLFCADRAQAALCLMSEKASLGRPAPRSTVGTQRRRLAALQALYQLEITGNAPDDVIEEFVRHRFRTRRRQRNAETRWSILLRSRARVLKHRSRSTARLHWCGSGVDACADRIPCGAVALGPYEFGGTARCSGKVVIDEYVRACARFFEGDEPASSMRCWIVLAHASAPPNSGNPARWTSPSSSPPRRLGEFRDDREAVAPLAANDPRALGLTDDAAIVRSARRPRGSS